MLIFWNHGHQSIGTDGYELGSRYHIKVKDMSAPIYQLHSYCEIDLMIGDPFELPSDYARVTDTCNHTLLTTQLQVDGPDEVDPEVELLWYSAWIHPSNQIRINRSCQIVHTIAGVAVDGYLNGSNVVFIPTIHLLPIPRLLILRTKMVDFLDFSMNSMQRMQMEICS